tara:strand:- start:1829 stop:2257 length:429 start_codon:yes stop_codon:yes gene_type:complete
MKLIFLCFIIVLFFIYNPIVEKLENQGGSCIPTSPIATGSERNYCLNFKNENNCNTKSDSSCSWNSTSSEKSNDSKTSMSTKSSSEVSGGLLSSSGFTSEKSISYMPIILLSLVLIIIGGIAIYKFSQNAENPPLTPDDPVS